MVEVESVGEIGGREATVMWTGGTPTTHEFAGSSDQRRAKNSEVGWWAREKGTAEAASGVEVAEDG